MCSPWYMQVILVGHDFGGACVSYAMEAFPAKISKAVFLAAAMLTSGQSTLDIFSDKVDFLIDYYLILFVDWLQPNFICGIKYSLPLVWWEKVNFFLLNVNLPLKLDNCFLVVMITLWCFDLSLRSMDEIHGDGNWSMFVISGWVKWVDATSSGFSICQWEGSASNCYWFWQIYLERLAI